MIWLTSVYRIWKPLAHGNLARQTVDSVTGIVSIVLLRLTKTKTKQARLLSNRRRVWFQFNTVKGHTYTDWTNVYITKWKQQLCQWCLIKTIVIVFSFTCIENKDRRGVDIFNPLNETSDILLSSSLVHFSSIILKQKMWMNRENPFNNDYYMVSFAVCIRIPDKSSLKTNNIYVD